MALLTRLSAALRLALNSFPGSRPAKKELGQILDAAAVLVSGSGAVPINAITPDGGTLAITGDETVSGAITAGTTVNAGAAGSVNARLEKNGTTSAIVYAAYDINRNYQLELSNTGIAETINAPTGQYTTALTANRADAWSITDGTNDLLVFVTTTGVRGVQTVGRQLGAQGADVASGGTITLGVGNYFDVTGTTTINYITTTGWTAGSMVTLQFDASVTVAHNTGSVPANTGAILLAGAVNLSATAGDTLTLRYDGTTWREIARAVI